MWKMFNFTNHDIDAIMVSALEGGIIYRCNKAEIADDYLGEDVSKQISRGDTLILYDDEEGEKYSLNKDKFVNRFEKWDLDLQNFYGVAIVG